jgi:hypothetical protein
MRTILISLGNFSQLKFVNGNRVSFTCCTLGCKDKNTLLSSFTGQSIFEITAIDAKDVSLFSMYVI